jgi:2-iminobutanoate/2-iminopropanoate deaminase
MGLVKHQARGNCKERIKHCSPGSGLYRAHPATLLSKEKIMSREIVQTGEAPKAIGPYAQAIKANGFVYTAGQIAIRPDSGEMVDGGIAAQTRQVFVNLAAVLTAAGTSMDQVVKATVFLRHMADFAAMNEVYAEHLGKATPARSTVAVAELPRGALVEIDLIAEV